MVSPLSARAGLEMPIIRLPASPRNGFDPLERGAAKEYKI
jgi:hypothetical protein